MADRNVKVVLSLLVSGFDAGAQRAKASAESLAQSIEKTGEATAQAEKDAAKAGADAAKRAADAKQALGDLSTVALTVGGVILAGVGVATKAYADFDKQMSAVKATGQDAVANFEDLRDAAIEAGASTAFSASEAAQGMEELLKAGVTASDVMGGGLKGALDLAAAGTLGVGEAAEIAATAMTQFGLSGNDVPHLADLLAAGAGKAQGEVTDLGAALKQSGLVASQFGLSIEETVGGLSAFAAAGLLGSDAGTSLKTMLQRLANPSKEAAREMEALGISAYDAQGNFVGLEGLAGQLESAMKGLTPQARDAAMAVIFGSDAVRAANVLYKNGADGIRDWTNAVNDQGYAAEVAKTKLDNLSGDLEALGGAFESAFIKSGSGVNDFARIAVQGLTGFVNLISQIPAPVLATGTAIAGLAGAGLVGAGGFIKLVQTGAELKATVGTLRDAFPKLDAAIGKVGWKKAALGAGILTAALIAQQVAAQANARAFDDVKVGADDLAAKLRSAGDAGKTLNEAFTLETRGLFSGVTKEVDGLGEALQRVLRADAGQQFEDLFNGMLTGRSAAEQMRLQFVELDGALAQLASSGNGAQAAAMFDQVAEAAIAQGIPVEELAKLFPDYVGQLRNSAGASGEAMTGAQLLAEGLDGTAGSAQSATDSLIALGNAALQLSGSEMGLEAAIDAATEAIQENGQTAIENGAALDINTAKGRDNKAALDAIASSAHRLTQAQQESGASAETMAASTARAREQFVAAARQMGMTEAAANQLADSYGLIPRSVRTDIIASGLESTRQGLASLDNQMRALNGRIVRIDVRQTTRQFTLADGGVLDATPAGIVQSFAHGGFHSSIGAQQPQIRPAGGAGILWAEEGAGPWEAFISGHPGKRRRSRWLLEETARRLGGSVNWATAYADGGIHYAPPYTPPPSYPGSSQSSRSAPGLSAEAIRAALDGATLRLGSVDPITRHLEATLVTSLRRH